MTLYDRLVSGTGALKKGDILDVSSDTLLLARAFLSHGDAFDPDALLDALQNIVGEEGTLLVRTWNWNFCKGVPFDYHDTPSAVGALGNVALRRSDFRRTQHPIYSFAVWGKYQRLLCECDHKSAWGKDSPFAFLANHGGKQLLIGSTLKNSFTFMHYVEEQTSVRYRYLKDFTGEYIDKDGLTSIRTYQMYVRDLSLNIQMTSDKLAPVFLANGALHENCVEGVPVSVIDLEKAYPLIESDILTNQSKTLCTITRLDGSSYYGDNAKV